MANFIGVGWSALMQLAFVPLYIKLLGIEAYGLLGFYATMFSLAQILDLGLSTTMNRQMARYSAEGEIKGEATDFVRTLEVVYWAIGIVLGIALLLAAPVVATRWIRASTLSPAVVRDVVMLMAALAAAQWPISFYEGGLLGLQRQALLNGLKVTMATVSAVGAVLMLWFVSRSIIAFFIWQAMSSAIYVVLLAGALWRSLPRADRAPAFTPRLIHNVWRFAAGMSGITLSALILTEMDKIMLSKLLPLRLFGYYVLAGTVGKWLYVLITPVFNTVFPRLTALASIGREHALSALYHRASQLMAVLIIPGALTIALFSADLLTTWTHNAEAAQHAAPIARILVIGTALNGLMNLPYALQLAHGWTSIGLYINAGFILTLVPAIFFMTTRFGPVGAALVWVTLNGVYMLIGVPLTHRRLLKGEARQWFIKDIGFPVMGAIFAAGVARQMVMRSTDGLATATTLGMVFLGIFTVTVLAAPQVRSLIVRQLVGGPSHTSSQKLPRSEHVT